MKIGGIITTAILICLMLFLGIAMIFNLLNDFLVTLGGLVFCSIAIYISFNFKKIAKEVTL